MSLENLKRLSVAFFRRLRNGQVVSALYLTYFYSYLFLYDMIYGTSFCNSQTAEEGGGQPGSTGNFPVHPKIVKKFIDRCEVGRNDNVIDIGCGSGVILHVLFNCGFTNITGVEYSEYAFSIATKNVSHCSHLIHGDALELDIRNFDALFFFNPFRGELSSTFFRKIPENIRTVIAINHCFEVDKLLLANGFSEIYSYRHPIYKNFNGKIYKK